VLRHIGLMCLGPYRRFHFLCWQYTLRMLGYTCLDIHVTAAGAGILGSRGVHVCVHRDGGELEGVVPFYHDATRSVRREGR
jgi:hypothetical protein